jgi:hypothetical protein
LAVPANVAVSMTGVGLEAASLKAAAFWGSAGGGGNADKVARAATAAARIGPDGARGQNARHENSGKRSFDRWTHDNYFLLCSPNLPQLSIKLSLLQQPIELLLVTRSSPTRSQGSALSHLSYCFIRRQDSFRKARYRLKTHDMNTITQLGTGPFVWRRLSRSFSLAELLAKALRDLPSKLPTGELYVGAKSQRRRQ